MGTRRLGRRGAQTEKSRDFSRGVIRRRKWDLGEQAEAGGGLRNQGTN